MIEHSLYFALGFFLAALLALAVLPAFWRRAYRLTRREIEATLPISPSEIAAERDQLRAKFAVEKLQMEQQISAINTKRHEDMKITGEKATRIAGLDDTIVAKNSDIAALTKERNQLDLAFAQKSQQLEHANIELTNRTNEFEAMSGLAQKTQADLEISNALAESQAKEISALRTNMAAQFQRVEEITSSIRNFKEETRRAIEEARAHERKFRESEKDLSILTRRLEVAEELASKRDATIAERAIKFSALQDKLNSVTSIAKEIDVAYKQELRKTNQLEALLKVREETITRLREDSAETARDLTKTIEKIRADRHKLQSDLSEARAKSAVLQREMNALKRLSSVSDLRIPKSKETTV